jgi:hypothetical protein
MKDLGTQCSGACRTVLSSRFLSVRLWKMKSISVMIHELKNRKRYVRCQPRNFVRNIQQIILYTRIMY